MAAPQIIRQFKNCSRFNTAGVVRCHAAAQGKGVDSGKACANLWLGQDIRVLLQHLQRLRAKEPVRPHRQLRRQTVDAQIFDQAADAGLLLERAGELGSLFGRNARDLRQLLRLLFQDLQRPLPKELDDPVWLS